MTDEEIEKTLRRNADNISGGFDSKVLGCINRLKAKNKELQDKNRRVLDWKRRQEKFSNEMIDRFDEELKKSKEQARKDTAKEIFQTILDDYRGVDYYSFLFEGLQAIADDEYGIRIMPSENGVSVEVDNE